MSADQQIPVPQYTQAEVKQLAMAQRAVEVARQKRRVALIALICMVIGCGVCATAVGMIYASVWPGLLVAGFVLLTVGVFIGATNG